MTDLESRAVPPEVDGLIVGEPVGHGARGPLWSARTDDGESVVLTVLAAEDAGSDVVRRLRRLRDRPHPHLAAVRRVTPLPDGRCAVVSERIDGASLAAVVAARGALTPGESTTLLDAVGHALAHLHEVGLVHGDVSPANVMITDDGVPVLVDLLADPGTEYGTPGFIAPECRDGAVAATTAADVWSLARVVEWAAGSQPARLSRELNAAMARTRHRRPDRRPSARDLAGEARTTVVRAPISLPEGLPVTGTEVPVTLRRPARATVPAADGSRSRGSRPEQSRADSPESSQGDHRRRRRHRRRSPRIGWPGSLGLGGRPAAVAMAVGAGAVAGVLGAAHWWPYATPAYRASSVPDPHTALVELVDRRDRAVTGDTEVEPYVLAGSRLEQDDGALLTAFMDAGVMVHGLRTEVVASEIVEAAPGGVWVRADLAQTAHERRSAAGTQQVAALPPSCTELLMARAAAIDAGWLLTEARDCD